MTDMENILSIRNLTVSYIGTRALSGVSLDVRRGEVLCVAGESGSGKSTLLKAICGNPELRVESGELLFRDIDLLQYSRKPDSNSRSGQMKLLGAEIGLIPQNPAGSFNPIRPLGVQFKETLLSHGIACNEEEITGVMGAIGLKEPEKLLGSRPYELSGGMNQRIAIAMIMLLKPALLLCDEVTSALDVTTAISVIDELVKLKEQSGITMLFVTHNLGIAREIADRIAVMYKGRIVECGETAQVLGSPAHDYTKKLLMDVPKWRL